jgi:hypothetical protein
MCAREPRPSFRSPLLPSSKSRFILNDRCQDVDNHPIRWTPWSLSAFAYFQTPRLRAFVCNYFRDSALSRNRGIQPAFLMGGRKNYSGEITCESY